MKEQILDVFNHLGFQLVADKDNSYYSFKYEGLDLLYLYSESDEDFFNIAVPGILHLEEKKIMQSCVLIDKINSTMKYIKACIVGENIWLFYERELFGGEDLMAIIAHMVMHLEKGQKFAHQVWAEMEGQDSEDSEDTDNKE